MLLTAYLKMFYWSILPNWYLHDCNSKLAKTRNPTDLCANFPTLLTFLIFDQGQCNKYFNNILIKENITLNNIFKAVN